MNEQKKNIDCRVCLRYDLKRTQKCFSLFEKYNNSLISEKIKYVSNIDIREGDGLPGKICPDCLLQLETALIFKQKCETSNKILLSIVQQPSKVCKIKFRVPVKQEKVVLENIVDNNCREYSHTEPKTTKLDISKNEIAKVEVPVNVLPDIEELDDEISQNEELANEAPDNKEPVDVLLDDEEPIDETSDNEETVDETSDNELVIDTSENKENANETQDTIDKIHDFSEPSNTADIVKKSKAIDLKLICDDCGGSFKSKCKLAVHWKKVHLPTKLICPKCKRIFKTFKAFNVHKKKKTRSCYTATKVRIEGQGKTRVFHCRECIYNTKNIKDMDAHLVTHSGDRRFQCKDCFKCFTQYASLQGHRESQHKDYRVETTCHYCGKLIKGRCKFYKHLRIHEPKCAQCEICKKILKSRPNLVNHMKRHSGIRSYTCETCSANFYTMAELCNHRKRVHFKAKTFKCDMCEYTSYTAGLLKTHRSRHTVNNVVCLMCGMFLDNAEKLAIHQKRHIEKNFCCPHCDKGFFLRDSLRRHMIKKHAVQNKQEPDKVKPVIVNIKQEHSAEHKFNNVLTLSPILS